MAALEQQGDLSDRDEAVVQLVAKFRQMTRAQIGDSLFSGNASATPLDRTLKRLLERKHLSRLRRLVGGDQGGSAQYVYQLGREGWRLADRAGTYWAPHAVNLHTLAIADCYVQLHRGARRGELEVLEFVTEPDSHQSVGNLLLTPDAYVETGARPKQTRFSYWLEVDRGTEHPSTIEEKCERYWSAYQRWAHEFYPRVLFVVPDQRRKTLISKSVEYLAPDTHEIFSVCLQGEDICRSMLI
ncbi:replication-relaxation family protein [Amycolatopsis sp. H20-H5]|uniref:replication-relaxation family protein n=1 Tax=Amycolatopsis sp. H20-H5 TaxID=3046309 RepID=UPI002DBE1C36|nr:replication-relaxation family protein [Amycolatopsis sp. H20-H5]MEC3978173.1 replication-relaxation family protein [Amycolatopsis sp. H20-H5]